MSSTGQPGDDALRRGGLRGFVARVKVLPK
jgi:hypothetical protein